jgi:hypothetical protein
MIENKNLCEEYIDSILESKDSDSSEENSNSNSSKKLSSQDKISDEMKD